MKTAPEGGVCRFSGGLITPALLRGPLPHSGGRRRKRAGLELLLRNPLFFLIFAVRVSQKFCRATTKLRLLLHQTKYSDSLLAQITKRFAFSCPDFLSLSTVRGELPNKGRTDFVRSPLIQYQMIHQPEVPPVLTVQPLSLEPGKRYAKRAFKTWWNGIDILLIDRQHFLNRKGVVCLLANQEGGAHVQPGMDEKAAMLRRGAANSLQIAAPLPDGQTRIYTAEIDQVLAAVVRTIAAETLYTFEHAILPRCQIALSADEKD